MGMYVRGTRALYGVWGMTKGGSLVSDSLLTKK